MKCALLDCNYERDGKCLQKCAFPKADKIDTSKMQVPVVIVPGDTSSPIRKLVGRFLPGSRQ